MDSNKGFKKNVLEKNDKKSCKKSFEYLLFLTKIIYFPK